MPPWEGQGPGCPAVGLRRSEFISTLRSDRERVRASLAKQTPTCPTEFKRSLRGATEKVGSW
jgi:hypothetical protein